MSMSLTPWTMQDPTSDWIQNFFEDPFYRSGVTSITPRASRNRLLKPLTPVLNMDLVEKEHEFCLCADLPGLSKDEIAINIENNVVHISAKRTECYDEVNDKFHYRERGSGKVERSIQLPNNANTDSATANYENGVLKLTFPKLVKGQVGKKICIA